MIINRANLFGEFIFGPGIYAGKTRKADRWPRNGESAPDRYYILFKTVAAVAF